ncbi:hypothetical protein L9F63_015842 [Diploptera punctata]|uniref:Ion transport domain-containing protein n=1 Tax=Diploptera punctata TaxID=6984 RepID=A0AAD8A5L4_DIPPU|nr:hypothetical protein L9F63_015842 [Diploptera punctata]
MTSIVQHQAKLLAALESRDLDVFTNLLEESQPDASCLEAACREDDCVEFVRLLLERGVEPNTLNITLQHTPLHVAAERGHYQIIEALLNDSRTDVNSLNGSEQTALHLVVKNCKKSPDTFRHCIILLVSHHVEVNSLDWLGNSALHYAAENEDQDTALLLLRSGAYLGTRNHDREMSISGLEPKTLETFLNSCIVLISENTLKMRYEFLVPDNQLDSFLPKNKIVSEETSAMLNSPIPEMDAILAIAATPRLQHLVSHPVLSTFTNVKWQRVCKFYFSSILFYSFYIAVLTTVILEQFLPRKPDEFCSQSSIGCFWKIGGRIILGLCCFCEVVKLVFTLAMSPFRYRHENAFEQITIMILAIVVLFGNVSRGFAALALLFSWVHLFCLAGQHPTLVVYFHLYKKICCTFLKIFIWTFLLIFAFSLSFFVLFQNTKTFISEKHDSFKLFWNPLSALFTTVGVFVGGFETKFLEFESSAIMSHIIFILFCFLIVVVLANMLTSIAVQHGETVFRESEWIRLLSMAKAVSNIEKHYLGNPLYMYLRMKKMKLNSTQIATWAVKWATSLWIACNWRRYLKGLQNMVVVHPKRSVVFPLQRDSNIMCKYVVPENILKKAVTIAKGDKCQDERLSEVQDALKRMEDMQRDIFALLKKYDSGTSE